MFFKKKKKENDIKKVFSDMDELQKKLFENGNKIASYSLDEYRKNVKIK